MDDTQAQRPQPTVTAGLVLVGIAVLHSMFGLLAGVGVLPAAEGLEVATPLLDIISLGVVGAVEPDLVRMTFAWFLLFGFALGLLGVVAHRAERRGIGLGKPFAWGLAGLSGLGVVLMPLSGFWLLFVPAWMAYRGPRASS